MTSIKSPQQDWSGRAATGPGVRHRGLAVGARSRNAEDFARARRHSRMVALLKFGLPAGAVVAVIGIGAAFLLAAGPLPSIYFGRTKIENGQLVMDKPELSGFDNARRPYNLSARKAVQDAERPTRISLEEISARLPMEDEGFADIAAGSGIYDADAKTLVLGGKVAVDSENGLKIRLDDADIDIETGSLNTKGPVSVDTGRAIVTADGLTVEDKGSRIIFESRVRMTIRPVDKAAASTNARLLDARPLPAATRLTAAEGADSQ